MKLEHFGMAEPGDCRVVFTASARGAGRGHCGRAGGGEPARRRGRFDGGGRQPGHFNGIFPVVRRRLVENHKLLPVTDPDFELLAVNRAEGFRAGAQFFCVPPLELGRYTGFVQPIQPRPHAGADH